MFYLNIYCLQKQINNFITGVNKIFTQSYCQVETRTKKDERLRISNCSILQLHLTFATITATIQSAFSINIAMNINERQSLASIRFFQRYIGKNSRIPTLSQLGKPHNYHATCVLNDTRGNKNYSWCNVGDVICICNKPTRHLIPVIYRIALLPTEPPVATAHIFSHVLKGVPYWLQCWQNMPSHVPRQL